MGGGNAISIGRLGMIQAGEEDSDPRSPRAATAETAVGGTLVPLGTSKRAPLIPFRG